MLKFFVEGSRGDEYEIVLENSGSALIFSCTCAAGISGTLCKHRLALLAGDVSALLSDNTSDLLLFKQILSGTSIEQRYINLCALEKEKEAIEIRLKAEKKAIAREMRGATISR